ncbi:acyl-CoA dehydrogenase family protein [Labrys neptuniae]
MLTERQKDLQARLIELCQSELRANAVESDRNRAYPRKNFQILAEHGFLGLIVPEELGASVRITSASPWWWRPSPATAAPPRQCATPCIPVPSPPPCCATTTMRP